MSACSAPATAGRHDWRPVRESGTGDGSFTLKHWVATGFASNPHERYSSHDSNRENHDHEPRVYAAREPKNEGSRCPHNNDLTTATDRISSGHRELFDFGGPDLPEPLGGPAGGYLPKIISRTSPSVKVPVVPTVADPPKGN